MTQWEYARVIVNYQGERTEVRGRWIFEREVLVQDWLIHWIGPDGESAVNKQSGTDAMPIDILNTWGAVGWEVVTALHSEGQFEYLLKRPILE